MSWQQVNKRFYLSLVVFLLVLGLYYGYGVTGPYLNSAHGNATYGVKRNVAGLLGYSRGNCAHCHEMHASINGTEPEPVNGGPSPWTLFATNFDNASAYSRPTTGYYVQSDDFCFYCHSASAVSLQYGGITNYDYSTTFGGAPINANATDIMDAFNQASYHNLYDIWNFAQTEFPGFFKAGSNPCVACHNPHIARKSCGKPGSGFDPTMSAISRPTDHGNLWGDNSTERMNVYATGYIYQAPYYYNSNTTYEPGGSSIYDGSNLPDYVSFCTDCHNNATTIYSSELGRNVRQINWDVEKHGKGAADGSIEVHPPFSNASIGYYVLSCLDCHEPHGSPNLYLIRREVNGGLLNGTVGTGAGDLGWLCRRCHHDDSYWGGAVNSWEYVHHYVGDYPYIRTGPCITCHVSFPIPCTNCHYHGATAVDSWGVVRRTF